MVNSEWTTAIGDVVPERETIIWPDKWQPILNYWLQNKVILIDDEGISWIRRKEILRLMAQFGKDERSADAQSNLSYHLGQVNKRGGNIKVIEGRDFKVKGIYLLGEDAKLQFLKVKNIYRIFEHMVGKSMRTDIINI